MVDLATAVPSPLSLSRQVSHAAYCLHPDCLKAEPFASEEELARHMQEFHGLGGMAQGLDCVSILCTLVFLCPHTPILTHPHARTTVGSADNPALPQLRRFHTLPVLEDAAKGDLPTLPVEARQCQLGDLSRSPNTYIPDVPTTQTPPAASPLLMKRMVSDPITSAEKEVASLEHLPQNALTLNAARELLQGGTGINFGELGRIVGEVAPAKVSLSAPPLKK